NSGGNSNVICSGSIDNTIRFWDIRSNKEELYMIKGDNDEDDGIYCLKFVSLKKKVNNDKQTLKNDCGVHLCYEEQFICEFMNKLLDVSNGLKKQLFANVFFCISIQLERE
ncbi:hypothetical protein RFI_26837, partial [Reticulomyxa filosa]